jgi:predicted ATPase
MTFNPTQHQCSIGHIHAQYVAEHLHIAYWMTNHSEVARDHQVEHAHEHLVKLCAELGYELTPITQPVEQEAA